MSDVHQFGYWGIRGLGHLVQLTMEICEFKYELAAVTDRDKFMAETKPALESKHNFMNLPYLKKGDFFLSESDALVQYVILTSGKKELKGKSEMDYVLALQMQGILKDCWTNVVKLAWDPEGSSKLRGVFEGTVYKKLDMIEKHLKEHHFLVPGNEVNFVDLYLLHYFQYWESLNHEITAKYPLIKAHQQRIMDVPQIKAFYASERCHKFFMPPYVTLKMI